MSVAERADGWEYEWAFRRTETRRNSLSRRLLDCGHWIMADELYSYFVGKLNGFHGLEQDRACEPCARRGKKEWQR